MMDRREVNRFLRNAQDLVGRGVRRATNAVGFIDSNGDLQLDGFNRPLPSGTFRWAVPWGPGDQVVVSFLGDTALIIANLSTGGPGDTGSAPPGDPPPDEGRNYARTTARDCNADPNAADLYQTKRAASDLLRLIDPFSISLESYAPTDLETLSATYAVGGQPNDLRAEARAQAELMLAACQTATGVLVKNRSAYRSCATQIAVFDGYVGSLGLEEADRQSARPGHSEHQLGLVMDLVSPPYGELDQAFGSTAEGEWIRDHAHEFGFVVSYPSEAAEPRTGYMWEPWHVRYIGKTEAAAFVDPSQTKYLNEWLRGKDAGAATAGMVPTSTGLGVQTRWRPITELLDDAGYPPPGGGGGIGHGQVHDLTSADHTDSGMTTGQVLTALSGTTFGWATPGSGVTDHGLLSGLGDDDHPQYQTAAEEAVNIAAHASLPNAHHAQAHVLATGTALGADHTISGAAAGEVLRALSATTAAFDKLAHTDLTIVAGDNHHPQAHALDSADHTGSITAAQHPSIASGNLHPEYETSAEAAAKITAHEALADPHTGYATDGELSTHAALATHHASSHVLATGTALGADHTISGAAAGEVLRALSATTAAWDRLAHTDLTIVAGDNHHPQAHGIGSADHTGTITGALHGTLASGDLHPEYATDADLTAHALTPHGGGAATDHGTLTGLGDDDHPQYVEVAGDTMTGTFVIESTAPKSVLRETDATADNGRWDVLVQAEQLRLRAVNDADSAAGNFLIVDRTGTTIDSVEIVKPKIGAADWGQALHAHAAAASGGQVAHTDLTIVAGDNHHPQSHVLATGTALGGDHTMSGAAAGEVLRALSATTAAWDRLAHTDLTIVAGDNHHPQSHNHSAAADGTALTPASVIASGALEAGTTVKAVTNLLSDGGAILNGTMQANSANITTNLGTNNITVAAAATVTGTLTAGHVVRPVGTNGEVALSSPSATPGVIFIADTATKQRADIARATGELTLGARDGNATPTANIRIGNGVGTAVGTLGFYGIAPIAKPAVTGAKAGNAALTNLCAALASLGLITNSTT